MMDSAFSELIILPCFITLSSLIVILSAVGPAPPTDFENAFEGSAKLNYKGS